MGLFSRPGFEFEAVVAGGHVYDAYTDASGRVWLDTDQDVEVFIDGVVIGGYVYPAYTDEYGRVYLAEDDDYA
jgi:hypothetical protein